MNDQANRPSELSLIERLHALEQQKRGLAEDIKAVKAEAKDAGYETAEVQAMAETVRRMLMTPKAIDAAAARRTALERLRESLGAFADTPLGESALAALKD